MNTNITYNRAGCTALLRGKIHLQSPLTGSIPGIYSCCGVATPRMKGICNRNNIMGVDISGVATPRMKGTCNSGGTPF